MSNLYALTIKKMTDRNADDDDFMEEEIDVFENLEIHIQNLVDKDPDKDTDKNLDEETFSDDNACNSGCSENLEDLVKRVVPSRQFNAINTNTNYYIIEFYYKLEDLTDMTVCTTCTATVIP